MIFGYARVSKKEQNLDMQIDALKSYGVDEIFEEKASTKGQNRPELSQLLKMLRTGDTLVVWKLDRLGRTVKQLLQLVEAFENKSINFVSLKENLDTSTATGKFCFHIFCAISQMERDVISERTKAGLEAAKARGRVAGRPSVDEKAISTAKRMYRTNDFSIQEIVDATGIKKSTLYKYLERDIDTGDNELNER